MQSKLFKWTAAAFLVLLLNTAYIAAFASPTIFYMGNVLAHLVLGAVLAAAVVFLIAKNADLRQNISTALVFFLIAFLAAIYLTVAGNVNAHRWVLWVHIAASLLGVLALIPYAWKQERFRPAFQLALALLALFPLASYADRKLNPNPNDRIHNPHTAPITMEGEGGGPKSPFFPSSAKTNVGGIIPSNFFMDSAACGECHKDIYQQWKSSVHHFASFNNQFYRKSIEYVQSVVGTRPSKWCAGCHDHAVFFNGRFDRPIKEQVDTPEARAGLACTSCHSIVHVSSTMGNGDFTVQYPPLHDLASSRNPYIHA